MTRKGNKKKRSTVIKPAISAAGNVITFPFRWFWAMLKKVCKWLIIGIRLIWEDVAVRTICIILILIVSSHALWTRGYSYGAVDGYNQAITEISPKYIKATDKANACAIELQVTRNIITNMVVYDPGKLDAMIASLIVKPEDVESMGLHSFHAMQYNLVTKMALALEKLTRRLDDRNASK